MSGLISPEVLADAFLASTREDRDHHVMRTRRASEPPEYPAALLDPRTCAHRLLRQLYPQSAPTSRPDREQRDRDIYRRHQAGESTEMLSKAFKLSVQRIRKIIRRLEGRA